MADPIRACVNAVVQYAAHSTRNLNLSNKIVALGKAIGDLPTLLRGSDKGPDMGPKPDESPENKARAGSSGGAGGRH
jgi:hypothetical protein